MPREACEQNLARWPHSLRNRHATRDDQRLWIDSGQLPSLIRLDIRAGLRFHYEQVPSADVEQDDVAHDGPKFSQNRHLKANHLPARCG